MSKAGMGAPPFSGGRIAAYLWDAAGDCKGTGMSGDDDLIKLYSQRILALAADIPLTERLPDPQVSAKRRSPLCGSTVTVDLELEDGRIVGFGQDVKACALGQASASVLGAPGDRARAGPTIARARDQLAAMLKAGGPVPDAPFDALEVLLPARDYKNRHASILLAWTRRSPPSTRRWRPPDATRTDTVAADRIAGRARRIRWRRAGMRKVGRRHPAAQARGQSRGRRYASDTRASRRCEAKAGAGHDRRPARSAAARD